MKRTELPATDVDRIACQQILEEDHSVFSIQTVVIRHSKSTHLSAERLLHLYFDYIERCTLGLIRVFHSRDGIEFRLAATDIAIIRFTQPTPDKNGAIETNTLRICGGVLVQPKECNRGQFDFLIEAFDSGSRVTLKLSDFCPLILGSSKPSLWRKWLYRLTQAYIHKIVTIRFLSMVYRELTGERIKKGVISIVVRQGKNT